MTASAPDITLACRVQPSLDALIQRTGGEAIVLDIASERYFGLNAVGARLWTLLSEDPELAQAHRRLLDEYDVPSTQLESDLVAIVGELAEAGLVSVVA